MLSSVFRICWLGAVLGCGGGHTGDDGPPGLKANLGVDLSRVAGFAIAPPKMMAANFRGEPAAPPASTNTLYAMGTDGTLTSVTVTTDATGDGGTTTSTASPVAIFDTAKYTFFPYAAFSCSTGTPPIENSDPVVALRKSDGALFCIPNMGAFTDRLVGPGLTGGQGIGAYFSQVQANASGDIIWINTGIAELSFADPANPIETTPIDPSVVGVAGGMAVNADGDLLFLGNTGIRVQKVGGGFVNAGTGNAACLTVGPASNPNDFYFLDNSNPQRIMQASKSAGFVPAAVASSGSTSSNGVDCSAGLGKANGHLFFPMGGLGPKNVVLDFVASPPTVTPVTIAALGTITKIIANGSLLMILGTDTLGNAGIVRYDATNASQATILAPGDFTVLPTAFSVATNGDLSFQGQRASDGAFVLGAVLAGTTSVTITQTGVPQTVQIQRIN
jgi:hypothetical protein